MEHITNTNIKQNVPTAVTLGNFDGVHMGHRSLINLMKEKAKEQNLKSIVFSFYPHPMFLFGTNSDSRALIMGYEEKKMIIEGMGVDAFPDYFPVAYNAKGGAKGNYYTLSQFKALSKIIDDKIISMGNALHNGEIAATPIGDADKNEGKMCSYCSYRPVCARENGESVKPLNKLTHIKALERLDGEEIE